MPKIKKILGFIRTTLKPSNLNDRIVTPEGKEVLFKSFIVSNVIFSIKKIENSQATLFPIEKLYNAENEKLFNFLDQYDLIVTYSTKNNNLLNYIENNKKKFLFVESPVLFRNVHGFAKSQNYLRFIFETPYGNNFIKKYNSGSIREDFPIPKIKNFEKKGKSILIINQLEGDYAIYPLNPYDWSLDVINKIRKFTDLKIIFRDHPLQKISPENLNKFKKIQNLEFSKNKYLENDLKETFVTVTFSSGAAVESLLNNTPVIALDKRSFVYEIVQNELSDLLVGKVKHLDKFFSAASNTHYSLTEIISDQFWNNMKRFFN